MDYKIKTIFPFIFILYYCKAISIFMEKVLVLDRIEGICKGSENIAMTLQNLTVVRKGKISYMSTKLVVKHDLIHEIEQILDLTRCRNKESLDSCETYNKMKFGRCCEVLNAKNQLWSPFVDKIQPPIKCPVKQGVYSIDNATFDGNVALFDVSGWYWKINVQSYDVVTREPLLCMKVEGGVQNYRNMQN